MKAFLLGGVAAATMFAAGHASATILLTPAQFSGGLSGPYHFHSLTPTFITHNGPYGVTTAGVTTKGGLKAYAHGLSTTAGAGLGQAEIFYRIAIVTAFPQAVHLIINAAAQAAGAGSWFSEAYVDIYGANVGSLAYAYTCHASPGCTYTQTGNSGGSTPVTLASNRAYTIHLSALGGTFDANSMFDAWADPTISFDPAYTAPADAQITLSPGAAPSVPEPAVWTTMLVGIGLAGAVLRRRRDPVANL